MFDNSIETNKCLIYNSDSKRRMHMKEMLQSKVLMGFVIFVFGFTYFSVGTNENNNVVLEEDSKIQNELVLK